MTNKLIEWVEAKRGDKSIRKLAKQLNISHTHVTKILSGNIGVTWGFAARVAQHMGLDPVEAFVMAGLLKQGAGLGGDAQTGPEKEVTTVSVAPIAPVVTNGVAQ